jgi:transcriptional regulator with XRE-family HTH domain
MDPATELRAARERAGVTQADLARRAGTSQATVSAYEAGRKQPSVQTLDRLLAAQEPRNPIGRGIYARAGDAIDHVTETRGSFEVVSTTQAEGIEDRMTMAPLAGS